MPGLGGIFGERADGTPKGSGFLGILKSVDGRPMTELSIGIEFEGKEIQIPSLVPTLTTEEVEFLRQGGSPLENKAIADKAIAHALERIRNGQSPFFD